MSPSTNLFYWYILPAEIQNVYLDAISSFHATMKALDKNYDITGDPYVTDLFHWIFAIATNMPIAISTDCSKPVSPDVIPFYLSALKYQHIFRGGPLYGFQGLLIELPGDPTPRPLLCDSGPSNFRDAAKLQTLAFKSYQNSLGHVYSGSQDIKAMNLACWVTKLLIHGDSEGAMQANQVRDYYSAIQRYPLKLDRNGNSSFDDPRATLIIRGAERLAQVGEEAYKAIIAVFQELEELEDF